jgi:Fic family protein
VDKSRFTSDRYGEVVKTPGPHGFYTYVPKPLPRAMDLSQETVRRLSEADRALGRLAGAGRLLPNPHLLVNAYIRREAVASSRIEGTQATLSEVFDAEARGEMNDDIGEVVNYVRAMDAGLVRLRTLPISRRLVQEIHEVLMSGVRGQEKQPGVIRSTPNWIGSPDNRPATAIFVPPPAADMEVGLSDWERFVHDEELVLPPLIRCALLHYQFETLHPFLDGNGRLGRLLIIFYLVSEQLLPAPLLYLSSYFELHKGEYYDRLQAVRETGDLDGWLAFFLNAVVTQATDALWRAERLIDLREAYREQLRGQRSRAPEIVDMVLENPFVNTAQVARRLGVTSQGALNLLRSLASISILTPLPRVPGRSNRWVAHEVRDILIGDTQAESS